MHFYAFIIDLSSYSITDVISLNGFYLSIVYMCINGSNMYTKDNNYFYSIFHQKKNTNSKITD